MLNLVHCELKKIKRKKLIQITLLGAFLFPIPLTLLMVKDHSVFNQLYRMNLLFGNLLLLPIILGIVTSMLIYMEKDNDTLKNILVIPISKSRLLLSKLILVAMLSVLYSLISIIALLVGNIFMNNVIDFLMLIRFNFIIGLAVFIAILPVIVIIVKANKGYICAIIVSVIYTIINFVVTLSIGSDSGNIVLSTILPIPLILRWCMGVLPTEIKLPDNMMSSQISTQYFIGIMTVYLILFSCIAIYSYEKSEN
ncbi:ABC transporter permease [Enterococcus sp. DIV0876]|uniref:ABC transporter permease n=1 Tax=Enterococcus sp. DIV0876 TaxID=2774633 RepID=UPI003D2FEE71